MCCMTREILEDIHTDPLDAYEDACQSEEPKNEWVDKYSKSPVDFFAAENLDTLKTLDSGKRMLWFSMSLRDLRVTPEEVEGYFEVFPDDLNTFKTHIEFQRTPESTREFNLWAMCSGLVNKNAGTEAVNRYKRDQYLEIFERRKLAPKHLLTNYSHDIFDRIKGFGSASRGFFKTFDQANGNPFGLDDILKTDEMFEGEEYKKMLPERKIEFLQLCLSSLQSSLVFNETNNSAFTKESVARNGKVSKRHNVAHSMLFNTFQPSSAYDLAQSDFEYEMNNTGAVGGAVEEYPFHRMLLQTLKEIEKVKDESGKTTDLLVEFWDKNRNPIFANAVTDALSNQDINRGASELLKRIKGNSENKNALTAVLYRLEFGRLGISEDGVRYLEKVYDLGEYNNPDFFVSRLTAQGDIGIFGEDDKLLKHFNLGDLSSSNKVVKAAVLDFVYDTLFIPSPNETEEMRAERERYLGEFKDKYFEFKDAAIFEQSDIQLNNLSFKEQGWLSIFWNKASDEEKERLTSFATRFGESGVKLLLLANTKGEKFKDELLSLSEKLSDEDGLAIFAKFSSILSGLASFDETVERLNKPAEMSLDIDPNIIAAQIGDQIQYSRIVDPEISDKVRQKIIARVSGLFEQLDSLESSQTEKIAAIKQKLDSISSEAILMQSMLLGAREMGQVDFNDLPDIHLYSGENITIGPKEKKRIKEIYKLNYADRPKMLEKLLDGLDESLEKDNADFHTLYFKDRLIGVMVFEYNGEQVYFGKFNIDPQFQGGKIGEQFMEEKLDEVARTHIISATCSKGAPVTPKYIERGFVAEGEFVFEEDKCLNIVRNDTMNEMFSSKSMDEEFIIDHVVGGGWAEFEDGRCAVLMTKQSSLTEMDFRMFSKDEGDSQWILTRMFKRKSGGEDFVFLVGEKVKKTKFDEYKKKVVLPQVLETRHAIIV